MSNRIALPQGSFTVDSFGASASPITLSDAQLSSGMAFLRGELEKLDPKLREPLTSVTWQRDIPVQTGGGWVDGISTFHTNYATSGAKGASIMGRETNLLPTMQADIGRDTWRTFDWGHKMRVPIVDQQRLQQIGRSLEQQLNDGIRLAYDKELDQNVYAGLPGQNSYGLINSPLITTETAENGSGGDSEWTSKTPQEIMTDINSVLVETWKASEYDLTGMANHVLIPPAQFAYINNTLATLNDSIYTYLTRNNIAKSQGVDLVIMPCRWCEGAGDGGVDRMVAYANNMDRVRFSITVPIHRAFTQPNADDMSYITPYLAQFSEVQWLYTQHAFYLDGI
ncbi:hypothetical protein FACS1894184_16380 [Clostridia bacterium]|nr:hypothetical protein FACS1894184_16380 [Clostridia bacterium]